MRSRFPGMDPYIEISGLWKDFHNKFIGEIERTLASLLPTRYFVLAGERSYVVLQEYAPLHRKRFMEPDVGIAERRRRRRKPTPASAVALQEMPKRGFEPVTMTALVEREHKEVFLEIREVHPSGN